MRNQGAGRLSVGLFAGPHFLLSSGCAPNWCIYFPAVASLVLRVIGARCHRLWCSVLAELAVICQLSGLIAVAGSQGVGWLLAAKVFNLEYQFAPWVFPAAIVGAALAVTLAGGLAASRLLRVPPMEALWAGGR